MTYAIGQEVVYIGPDYRNHPHVLLMGFTVATPGVIYHIRSMRPSPGHGTGYFVREFSNPHVLLPAIGVVDEPLSIPHAFLKSLDKCATAISTLLALQNPANHKHMDTVE